MVGRATIPSNGPLITWADFGGDRPAGPIISLSVFGRSIFVLGTAESASLLLDKQSAINSDRPVLQMAGKL